MEEQSFEAPFDEISAYTGMRDLTMFEVGGSAVVHRNFVRLTGERQSQKGWVAARTPMAAPEWSATLELRASGTSMHLYGDGAPPAPTRASGDLARRQPGPHRGARLRPRGPLDRRGRLL